MAEYPGNSNKQKEGSLVREPIEIRSQESPQAEHPTVPTKATSGRRISPVKEVFAAIFPGEAQELKERIIWDIFVPWAQDILHTGWQSLGDVIFPGSGGNTRKPSTGRPPEQYSYNNAYVYPTVTNGYDAGYYNEMRPMRTREDAEEALRDLRNIWLRYRVVTLLDFNERVGNPTRPTQSNYGWLSLDSARIERSNGGWIINMPRAVAIDNLG